jgi:uncharacterized protein with HEPN domain
VSLRKEERRLKAVLAAAEAIRDHLTRSSLDDGLVYDAVRVRFIEIGEAVKGTGQDVLDREPSIVSATVERDLPPLIAAVLRLLEH